MLLFSPTGGRGGDVGSLGAGLSALSQTFKVRLQRHPNEKQLKDNPHHAVMIEPLAAMTALEDYLWPRVYRSEAELAAEAAATAEAEKAAAAAADLVSSV